MAPQVAPVDPIRIVPTHQPPAQAPAATPQLTYRGGPVLTACEVVTVFWGAAWGQGPQAQLIDQLNAFFDAILVSPLIDQLTEYDVPGKAIGRGRRIGTQRVAGNGPRSTVSDRSVRTMLQRQIGATAGFPQPGPNVLYFVYLPPGVTVTMHGSASCTAFCGYHDDIGGKVFYAVMPFPDCQGCLGSLDQLAALTSTSSHELCEAITDPIPGQGWYDDSNGEIGDICAWQTKQVAGYTVQREWSNRAGSCV
jgi:hypothetical protein